MFMLCFACAMLMQTPTPKPAAPQPYHHDCHVYAVDIVEARKLQEKLLELKDPKPEDLKKLAAKAELRLGEFTTEIGEEVATTKSYPLPGTNLTVTATVYYTDEMMDLSNSMLQGVVVQKGAAQNAISVSGAAVTEVNLESTTYKVRTKQNVTIQGRPWMIGLECQCMTPDERQKQLSAK